MRTVIAWRFTSPFSRLHELVLWFTPLLKEEGGAIVRLVLSESLIDADFKISRINLFHTLLLKGFAAVIAFSPSGATLW